MKYDILLSGSALAGNPTELFFGLFYYDGDEALEIPGRHPFEGEWGRPLSTQVLEEESYPIPYRIDMIWLDIPEGKFYSLEKDLPTEDIQSLWETKDSSGNDIYRYLIAGMAPGGRIALWAYGPEKSSLIGWYAGKETSVDMEEFIPMNPDISLREFCLAYGYDIMRPSRASMELRTEFGKMMNHFKYRYVVLFQNWNEEEQKWENYEEDDKVVAPELCYIEDSLSDGTFDKLHDEGLFKYHFGGKPQKMTLKWKIKKSEYSAHLWFEDERICYIFEKFYGVHRDTNTDFIIHIDVEKRKYELALYRYGLSEPVIIPEETYQMIVFKNKFEHYRSQNYSQRRGAWIW